MGIFILHLVLLGLMAMYSIMMVLPLGADVKMREILTISHQKLVMCPRNEESE